MKVLLLNGSTHARGCTAQALEIVANALNQDGIDTEMIQIGMGAIHDCIGCGSCKNGTPACVFKDDCVNTFIEKAQSADGFIFGSPVYYAHPNGAILSALDRIFYAGGQFMHHKPAAAILTARRAGTTASMDVINKYFTINQMPIVSSTYWNQVYRDTAGTPNTDAEGTQTLQHLAHNIAWLLKCIDAGQTAGIDLPNNPKLAKTNLTKR